MADKSKIVEMACYISRDMEEIAKEVNKSLKKANEDEISIWAYQLLDDVSKFCKALNEVYDTRIDE